MKTWCVALVACGVAGWAAAQSKAGTAVVEGPAASLRAVQIKLRRDLIEHRVYFGKRLVYMGLERCMGTYRCDLVGPHRVYHLNGKLQRVIDYSVSRTHQFEGKADRERTTTWFDAKGRPSRVTHARLCTECDWTPYGNVRVRNAKGHWQNIDTESLTTAEQTALEEEAQDNNYWPPLLGSDLAEP